MSTTTMDRFPIKLNSALKTALKQRASKRGLDLSAYIQEILWRHCPEAEEVLKAETDHDVAR